MKLRYYVDEDTGLIWSRYGDKCAVPVLDYDNMVTENCFEAEYYLALCNWSQITVDTCLRSIRSVPAAICRVHKNFWRANT